MGLRDKHIVCLYEYTGLSALEFAKAGYSVYCYDNQYETDFIDDNGVHRYYWDATDEDLNMKLLERHFGYAVLMMAFPPCTDLAVSGARHFAGKAEANPNYREEAMHLVYVAKELGETLECPFFIENPVSVISSEWRKPDFYFHPYEYGGYLPEDDKHPVWPDVIPPRDAYTKKTCLWAGNGFQIPPKRKVEVTSDHVHKKLGGKSLRTKNIRSATPRGFGRALFEYYNA